MVNSTGDPANEYFSDGMSEEFISSLSRLQDLKVVGRTSSFQFKGKTDDSKTIGEKLGVYYLLEGSVRKSADRVRIAVALIKSGDGANVWSETYDRELKDIFAVQSEIAGAVAKELKVALLGEQRADRAVDHRGHAFEPECRGLQRPLAGKFYYNRRTADDTRKAIGYYEEAIRLDPRYALAYAKLSNAAVALAISFRRCCAERRRRADRKSPCLGEERARAGSESRRCAFGTRRDPANIDFNFAEAEAEFRRALELAPQNAAVTAALRPMISTLGRLDEAVALAQRAIALDPLRSASHFNLALYLTALGRYDEAEAAVRKAIELQPQARHELCAACDYSDSARQIRRRGGIGETGNRSVLAHLRTGAGPLCQRRPGRGRRGPEKTDRRKRRRPAPARSLRCMHCARNRRRCSSGWSTPGPRTTQV